MVVKQPPKKPIHPLEERLQVLERKIKFIQIIAFCGYFTGLAALSRR